MVEFFGIVPQDQPTGETCVQTCLAMCLGVPVSTIVAIFGDKAMAQQDLIYALFRCRVVFNQFVFGSLVHQGWYFAAVPSLNHRSGMHEILLHFTFEDKMLVLDPAMGVKYSRDGSDLVSWSDLVAFFPGGTLPPG